MSGCSQTCGSDGDDEIIHSTQSEQHVVSPHQPQRHHPSFLLADTRSHNVVLRRIKSQCQPTLSAALCVVGGPQFPPCFHKALSCNQTASAIGAGCAARLEHARRVSALQAQLHGDNLQRLLHARRRCCNCTQLDQLGILSTRPFPPTPEWPQANIRAPDTQLLCGEADFCHAQQPTVTPTSAHSLFDCHVEANCRHQPTRAT